MDKPIAIIEDRYRIYSDGCVYDEKVQEIPQEIFQIRDIIIEFIKLNK